MKAIKKCEWFHLKDTPRVDYSVVIVNEVKFAPQLLISLQLCCRYIKSMME